MQDSSLEDLPDDVLLEKVRRLTAHSNVALAELLAHLGEVELRGIHRTRACASLYTYCIYELRMSEDAAFRRAKAARLVRRYPEVQGAIAMGEIHLTGLLVIASFLGGEHHAEVLRRARFRSKRELLRLVAEIDPKPAVPALVEPLGPSPAGRATHAAHLESLMGSVRELPIGARPENWIDEKEPEMDGTRSDRGHSDRGHSDRGHSDRGHSDRGHSDHEHSDHEHSDHEHSAARSGNDANSSATRRPLHYKVQFTASQRYVDLLEEALALLGRERPRPDLPDVQLRALELFVAKLRAERGGEASDAKTTASERSAAGPAPARVSRSPDGQPGTDRPAPARVSSPPSDEPGTLEPALARVSSPPSDEPGTLEPALARVSSPPSDEPGTLGPALARVSSPPSDEPGTLGPAPARVSRSPRGRKSEGRYIPRGVRRFVWARDGGRCAYVDDRGVQCRETACLELHHRHAHALGGPNTADNLELRCAAHNALAAEADFGREHLDRVRPSRLGIDA